MAGRPLSWTLADVPQLSVDSITEDASRALKKRVKIDWSVINLNMMIFEDKIWTFSLHAQKCYTLSSVYYKTDGNVF